MIRMEAYRARLVEDLRLVRLLVESRSEEGTVDLSGIAKVSVETETRIANAMLGEGWVLLALATDSEGPGFVLGWPYYMNGPTIRGEDGRPVAVPVPGPPTVRSLREDPDV